MSYMRGDLLTKTRKLVKGLAKATPKWLKAMVQAPPVIFPRVESKVKAMELPEDVYIKKFFKKHPKALYYDALKTTGVDPPHARVYAWRVLELKEQGVGEYEAMAVADMEYVREKRARKKAYKELEEISTLLDKKPPPNPYPSAAIKEMQEEEKPFFADRLHNPRIRDLVRLMLVDKAAEGQEQQNAGNMVAGYNQQGGGRYPARPHYPGDNQQGGGQYPSRPQYPGDNQQFGGRYPYRPQYPGDNQQGGGPYPYRPQYPGNNQLGGGRYFARPDGQR